MFWLAARSPQKPEGATGAKNQKDNEHQPYGAAGTSYLMTGTGGLTETPPLGSEKNNLAHYLAQRDWAEREGIGKASRLW